MKPVISTGLAFIFLLTGLFACTEATVTPTEEAKIRIGVYDSRSIAVAFAGTSFFNQEMSVFQKEYNQAKASGDQQRVTELEAEAQAQQQLLHMQAFSTAPVNDILEYIRDSLPGIQQQAGVSLILSKWDAEALAQYPSAELVDITMMLVDALQPNTRQRDQAISIQKQEPIPLEQAEKIED